MHRFTLLLLVLAPAAVRVQAVELSGPRAFEGVRTLQVRMGGGECRLSPSTDGKVHVEENPLTSDTTLQQTGTQLRVQASPSGRATLHLWVPGGLVVHFQSTSANLRVERIQVDLQASTATGQVEVQGVQGSLRVASASGQVRVKDCDGMALTADTALGGQEVVRVKGRLNLRTGSGRVTLSDFSGELGVSAGSGDVLLRQVSGNLGVSSGSGDIQAERLALQERGTFTSGSGDVVVDMPEGSAFRLQLQTGSGDAQVRLHGRPARGFFEFSVTRGVGTVAATEAFDRSEELPTRPPTLRTSFTRGAPSPQVFIRSGSGRAELLK